MKKTPLEKGLYYLSRRRFAECLLALEPAADLYRDSFVYYLTGGLACLYLDDFGSANLYFQRARQFSSTNPTLLLGQAVLFLRHGDTNRAVQYYLDVLEQEPKNRIAKKGMAFIKEKGTAEDIFRLIDNNKLKDFYPSIGINPDIFTFALMLLAVAAVAAAVFLFMSRPRDIRFWRSGNGLEAQDFYLSTDDLKNIGTSNFPDASFSYHYTDAELEKIYRNAYKCATAPVGGDDSVHRANTARLEANKILNSNASDLVKSRARDIIAAIEADREHEPTFNTLLEGERFSCSDVMADPLLYNGCWIVWSGRLYNEEVGDGTFRYEFYVYDDSFEHPEGRFDIEFTKVPAKPVQGDRMVQVLAKIESGVSDDGGVYVLLREKEYIPMMRNQSKVQSLNQK